MPTDPRIYWVSASKSSLASSDGSPLTPTQTEPIDAKVRTQPHVASVQTPFLAQSPSVSSDGEIAFSVVYLDSIGGTVSTAATTSGRTVLFPRKIVWMALLGLFTVQVGFIYGVGIATALSVLIAMVSATIKFSVFPAFICGGQKVIQECGIGLAAAVAFNATLIRSMLVPALMQWWGSTNWWLPNFLVKRIPRTEL